MDKREQFAERLEVFLKSKHVTRRQAGEAAACTGATIGRWIRGEVPYSILVLAELRRTYGADLNELICGDEE